MKNFLFDIWTSYKPGIFGILSGVGAVTLAQIAACLGIVSAVLGILYTGSMLYWGWVQFLRGRAERRARAREAEPRA